MTTVPKSNEGRKKGAYLGRILDERYRLDEVIGAGAIGKVYAGTQLAVDRKVAIKLLHPAIRDRELGKERFLREAKAVARMSHGSCLTLFDFGSDDDLGCFYMVTEFVEGTTLANEMQRGKLPLDRCYHVLYQVTTALQHAHDRGILHRDLKPENIMLVAEDGVISSVKVLDFGLARIREEAAQSESEGDGNVGDSNDSRLTNFGELNGTPAYMSPEQCRGDLDLTPACDYYSLGVLAYELIEGRLPFDSSLVQRLLAMHLHDPIPQMPSGRAPDPIEEMIYRLLAKKPEHRLQSAEEILEILRPYVTLEPSREFSRTSIDRQTRETLPSSDASAEIRRSPVAEAGAETLVNYEDVDTPLPLGPTLLAEDGGIVNGVSRGSAFGTMLAPEQEVEAQELPESSRRHLTAGVIAVLLALGVVGSWTLMQAPSNESQAAEQHNVSAAEQLPAPEPSVVDEKALTGTVRPDEKEVEHEAAGAEEMPEDDEAEEVAAEEESPPQPASRPSDGAKREPKPAASPKPDEKEDRQRPRKLELTY